MRTSLIIILIYSIAHNTVDACCFGPKYTLTEVLNNPSMGLDIFTCTIIKTYKRSANESIAVINNRYRGAPADTIYLNTGGDTSAGGAKLSPGTEHLIISSSSDNLHYGAYVCDRLSYPLSTSLHDPYDNTQRVKDAQSMLELLDDYLFKEARSYSGPIHYFLDTTTFAKGHFLKGKPHGRWCHHETTRNDGKLKSIINYEKGIRMGNFIEYDNSYNEVRLDKRGAFMEGELAWEETRFIPSSVDTAYTRIEYVKRQDGVLITYHTAYDTLGILTTSTESHSYPHLDDGWLNFRYKNGDYLYTESRGIESRKGQYHRGAKYGEWEFTAEDGSVSSVDYGTLIENKEPNSYASGDKKEGSYVEGTLIDGKKQGLWKVYYNGELTREINYVDNLRQGETIKYSNEQHHSIYKYDKGRLLHSTSYDKDKTISSMTDYSNGKANRTSTIYKGDTIYNVIQYKNDRQNGYQNTSRKVLYENGYEQGPIEQYDPLGKLMYKGQMWYGNRVGKWTIYNRKDDGYQEIFYETDPNKLMFPVDSPNSHWQKWYDGDGNLIKEKDNMKEYLEWQEKWK